MDLYFWGDGPYLESVLIGRALFPLMKLLGLLSVNPAMATLHHAGE